MEKEQSCGIKVVVRIRPINKRELVESGNKVCVKTSKTNDKFIAVTAGDHDEKEYFFDRVFDESISQAKLYEFVAKPIVEDCLNGYNGTVFAYGQTGSGKTHTMSGPDINDEKMKGVVPRMIETLLTGILEADETYNFKVLLSFVEIYCEKVNDLIETMNMNLKLRETKDKGVYIENAAQVNIGSQEDFFCALEIGNNNRKVQATNMNDKSSRSHSVLIIHIYREDLEGSTQTGKLCLVDLAGSECVGKTQSEGQVLNEAKSINKSLSALGQVIKALTENSKKKDHVPYRNSKLTRLLQESLGGNSKTALVIAVSPSIFNDTETLSSIRFGQSAKMIKNVVVKNAVHSVLELTRRIEELEFQLNESLKQNKVLEQFIKDKNLKLPDSYQASPERTLDLKKEEDEEDQEANAYNNEEYENLSSMYSMTLKEVDTLKEALHLLEDTLADKDGELSKMEHSVKYSEEEIKFLKDYNQKLIDASNKKDEGQSKNNGDQLALNLKAILEQPDKAEVKLKQVAEYLGANLSKEDVDSSPFENFKKELILKSEELNLIKREKNSLENKIKYLETEMLNKNSRDSNKTIELLKEQWDKEKNSLYDELSVKSSEILNLKLEISSLADKVKNGDKGQSDMLLKKNLVSLERNMEYMTMMYHRVVSQKSALKVENSICEKRIAKKKERVDALEKKITELRDQNNHYKLELDKLKHKIQVEKKPSVLVKSRPDYPEEGGEGFPEQGPTSTDGKRSNPADVYFQSNQQKGMAKYNNMYSFGSGKLGNNFYFNRNFKKSNIMNIRQLQRNEIDKQEKKKTDKKAYEDMINKLKSNNNDDD